MASPHQSDQSPVTHRKVVAIAAPVVLSNATVPILGAVDTGVVGQMGMAEPIAAVGLGAIVLTAVYWIFSFLRLGTAGLASQAVGQGDHDEAAAILTRAMGLAVMAGTILILAQALVAYIAFQLTIDDPAVKEMAEAYMRIRIYSAPAAIGIYAISGWLIGYARTTSLLIVQLWMNGLNIVLDLWFVLGLGWGVEGVAFATFIAEWTGLALGLWLCRNAFDHPGWKDWARIADGQKLRHFASVNTDITIRSMMLEAIFVSFLFFGERFGVVKLAANQILLQFLHITAYAMDGFAIAAETLVGQAMGAKNRARLRQAARLSSFWGFVSGLVLAVVFALFGGQIIDLMATDPQVRAMAREFLPYMIAAPLVGAAPWMLDGIFIGATRTRDMRNMMVISAAFYFVCAFALMPSLGNHGLWVAFLLSFVMRGLTMGLKYPGLEAAADR